MALIDGLISYWKFDEASGTVIDSHGDNDGSSTATFGATGKINDAYDFDSTGADERVTIPDDDSLSFGDSVDDSPFSISVWFKADTLTGNRGIVSKEGPVPATSEYLLVFFSGVLRFGTKDSTLQQTVDADFTFSTGTWYHVVCTYDGRGGANAADGMKIYVNDSDETTNPIKQAYTAMHNTVHPVFIGDRPISAAMEFDGIIDEVGIWGKEITSGEVTELYNSGNGLAYPFAVGTNMQINISDVFKDIESLKINIGNVWKDVVQVQQNIGDVWKTVFG